jgi:DNA primase
MDYLNDRGLDESDIEKWRLGLVPRDTGNNKEKYLAGRLAFPIMLGREDNPYCVGMAYRAFDENSAYKYVYDAADKTPSFKGRNAYLYGFNYAKAAAKKSRSIIITEGYMDARLMQKTGYYNTVASMGVELADTQVELLKGIADKVYLFWDGDAAGMAATPKAAEVLIRHGFNVFMISTMNNKDPADMCQGFNFDKKRMAKYIKENCNIALREIINNILSLYENKVLALQTNIYKEINDVLLSIPDLSTREIYSSFVKKRLL